MIKNFLKKKIKDRASFIYNFAQMSYDEPVAAMFILGCILLIIAGIIILFLANPMVFGFITVIVYGINRMVKLAARLYKERNFDEDGNY